MGLTAQGKPLATNGRLSHFTVRQQTRKAEDMVELRPAYSWDCDECGAENFTRGLIPELSAEDLAELRDEHGVQPWEAGDFMAMPDTVKCHSCAGVFPTQHMKDG